MLRQRSANQGGGGEWRCRRLNTRFNDERRLLSFDSSRIPVTILPTPQSKAISEAGGDFLFLFSQLLHTHQSHLEMLFSWWNCARVRRFISFLRNSTDWFFTLRRHEKRCRGEKRKTRAKRRGENNNSETARRVSMSRGNTYTDDGGEAQPAPSQYYSYGLRVVLAKAGPGEIISPASHPWQIRCRNSTWVRTPMARPLCSVSYQFSRPENTFPSVFKTLFTFVLNCLIIFNEILSPRAGCK